MARILLLETSTINCSVALWRDGEIILVKELAEANYVHAEKLHVFIDEVLKETDTSPKDLDSVAVSSGPGSYTGLRIGISAAKGLCFALQKPLISVDTLKALAEDARRLVSDGDVYLPMIDARRMEVYLAIFDHELKKKEETSAVILSEDFFAQWKDQHLVLCGDGAFKCKELIQGKHTIITNFPSATMLASIAEDKFARAEFEDVAYYEPFYLKEYIPGVAGKQV